VVLIRENRSPGCLMFPRGNGLAPRRLPFSYWPVARMFRDSVCNPSDGLHIGHPHSNSDQLYCIPALMAREAVPDFPIGMDGEMIGAIA